MLIGYTTGVFDMFHIGHLNILRGARERCDYLIVGVSTDECAYSYKHRAPLIPYCHRAAIIEAIKFVDEVVPQTSMNKLDFFKTRHVDVYFHGSDWKGTDLFKRYEEEFIQYGVRIEYLPYTEGICSSILRSQLEL